jgi:hypothetical protein
MDDLVIKLFQAESGIEDATVAEAVMLKYGLAEPYVAFAAKLYPLLDGDTDEAFADGADSVRDIVASIRFGVEPQYLDSELVQGINLAMATVLTAIAPTEVDLAPTGLSKDGIEEVVKKFFREQAQR